MWRDASRSAKLSPSAPPPPETPAQPPPSPLPRTFTMRQGGIGIRVDGHSYVKKLVRKRDKAHVWICNQNKCTAQLETTSCYKILKFPVRGHSHASIEPKSSDPAIDQRLSSNSSADSDSCANSSDPSHPQPPPPQTTVNESTVKTFKTRKGGVGVTFKGCQYFKKKVKKRDNIHVWQCNQKQCSAKLETTAEYMYLNSSGCHTHAEMTSSPEPLRDSATTHQFQIQTVTT